MRYVLYSDEDMEPITVVDLPISPQRLFQHRVYYVPVLRPPKVINKGDPIDLNSEILILTVWPEWIARKGKKHPMLFVDNDALAMELKATLLPGQRNTLDYLLARSIK